MPENEGILSQIGNSNFLAPVTGLIQSLINQKNAKQNTERTIQANMDMAQYQYSKDLEMWNRGNEYNAPASQMERLKAAGLNPNMVYGHGSATQPAVQLPKYQAPTAQYNYEPAVNLPEMLNMFQDFRLKQAQIDSINTSTKLNAAKEYIMRIFAPEKASYDVDNARIGAEYGTIRREIMEASKGFQINKYQFDSESALYDSMLKQWAAEFTKISGPAGIFINLLRSLFR